MPILTLVFRRGRPIAQVESALVLHPAVSEAAVVGFPDAIKGQAICCYVTFVSG